MDDEARDRQENDDDKLYFGGLPTDIELNKLKDAYPVNVLTVGHFIPYGEIEMLLGIAWRESRFKTVTNRWRRVVESETNIFLNPDPGEGFRVLSDAEKLALSGKKIGTAGKCARRAFVINSRIDRKQLTDEEKAVSDHFTGVSAKIHAASQIKNQIELPKM